MENYRGSNSWQKGVDYLKNSKFNPYSRKRKLIMINMSIQDMQKHLK